ncbi:metallophosphatase family protein [bacterium]|nr:metallophosphatase family protein [bacterium]
MLHLKNSDEIWHAGDIGSLDVYDKLTKLSDVKAVYGNIDDHKIRIGLKSELFFKCEGVNIYMTHIGGYPGKYSKGIKEKIEKTNPNIFICGHSHILKIMNDKKNKLLFLNPGAAGNHGVHKVKTIIKFDIDDKEIRNLKIIELKR